MHFLDFISCVVLLSFSYIPEWDLIPPKTTFYGFPVSSLIGITFLFNFMMNVTSSSSYKSKIIKEFYFVLSCVTLGINLAFFSVVVVWIPFYKEPNIPKHCMCYGPMSPFCKDIYTYNITTQQTIRPWGVFALYCVILLWLNFVHIYFAHHHRKI